MDADFIAQFRHLHEHHWWWRTRLAIINRVLDKYARRSPGSPVLDVGCGDGLMFDDLSRFGDVFGIEADSNAVDDNGPWRSRIHVGRFDESFRPDERFHLVTMLDVLEHLPDAPGALERVRQLMADDGLFVLTVPAFNSLWTSHDEICHHYTRYTRGMLLPMLRDAGFDIVQSRYLFHWTAPAKVVIRLNEWLFNRRATTPKVPSPFWNRFFAGLTAVEERISRVIPVPFGTSLLVVARPTAPAIAGSISAPFKRTTVAAT